jgi:hypothetical protein
MYRELKIVVSVFLLFIIYGLSSFFSLGAFVTPYFFSKLILVIVSLLFFLLNFRVKKSYFLFFAFINMVCFALIDDFTVQFLSERFQLAFLLPFVNSLGFAYFSFGVFVGFYSLAMVFFHQAIQKKWLIISLILLFMATILLFIVKVPYLQEIIFGTYLLVFFIAVNRFNLLEKNVLTILSSLFLLQFLLEIFKYLL